MLCLRLVLLKKAKTIPAEQTVGAIRQLNRLLKFIAAKNSRNLWRREEVIVFLSPSQPRYLLGQADTDAEWCLEENFTSSKLNGSASEGDTSLTFDSTDGMRAGDRMGLAMSDTTRDWMSLTSIDSSTTATVPCFNG